MHAIQEPLNVIRSDRRAYLWVNALCYGSLLVGMVVGMAFPSAHLARTAAFTDSGLGGQAASLMDRPWLLGVLIFFANVIPTAFLLIVLPSLIVPFAGLAVFAAKAVDLGIQLAPAGDGLKLVPHSITIAIEFQAYVLVMFGAYLLGRAWLRPAAVGRPNHVRGYLHGVRQLGWLAIPALALLLVGAAYEVLELRYLIPLVMSG